MIGQRIIGNYVVTELLGEGGMGAVYTAHNQALDERLAVKVLHPQMARHPQMVERFIAEARAASAIKHPNIIKMVDTGQLPTGEHFIAMEYLDGYPLDTATFPLPLDQALQILVQVCSGLEAAHARGIIHRDLKPANLFVSPQPGNPHFTKILDFGIAKLIDQHLAGSVQTRTGQLMGTPTYMSPEQLRATKEVDHLTDVYAMGAIAFELVTGKRAYEPSSVGDLAIKQATEGPRDPTTLRHDLPARWAQAILSALATEQMVRPQSVRELAELLIAATPNGVALARAVGFEPRAGLEASATTPEQTPGTRPAAVAARHTMPLDDSPAANVGSAPSAGRTVMTAVLVSVFSIAGGILTGILLSGGF
jgi:serine/threonine-protein kinase